MHPEVSPSRPARLWPVALGLGIFFASSRSRLAGPDIQDSDKVVHFLVFGLLASLVCRLGRGWRAAAWAVLAVSLFGISDEWHQSFVPGRDCSAMDWLADTLGAALAVTVYTAWPWYRRLMEFPLGRKRRIEKAPAAGTLGRS
ncbi:MAG: VanZ family protein [Verrucomicrobia bacterium]|nr:VanZ family protein [Verrucomicrobiota bacterium]